MLAMRSTLLCALLALLWLGGCTELELEQGVALEPASPPTPEFDDPLIVIDATPGESFAIRLPSGVMPGDQWRLQSRTNPQHVRLVAEHYVPPTVPLVAPGEQRWQFQAVGRGVSQIQLKYVGLAPLRQAERTVAFDVIVR